MLTDGRLFRLGEAPVGVRERRGRGVSLNSREREVTGEQLRRHVEVLGVSEQALAAWLDLEPQAVEDTVAVRGADPVVVWLVRDGLDGLARHRGVDAGGWTVLTDSSRQAAQRWFRLRVVPPVESFKG